MANLPIAEKYLAAYLQIIPDVPEPKNTRLLDEFINSHIVSIFSSSSSVFNFLK